MKLKMLAGMMILIVLAGTAFGLKIQYRCGETNASTTQIRPIIKIVNNDASSVALSDLKVRYWYTKEGTSGEQFSIDYTQTVPASSMSATYATGYFEVSFVAAAGSIAAGSDTGEIQMRINKTDWTAYTQSDDWSFDGTKTAFADWSRITIYRAGTLVWGEEVGTPAPTEAPTPVGSPLPTSGANQYVDRFIELWNELHDPANGYFSAEGAPYHCDQTVITEAPDQGHESTSEAYSYYVWLEAQYGRVTGDWSYLKAAWDTVERHIIPSDADQPGNSTYKPASPATYAPEWDLPDNYPSELAFNQPVGVDPLSTSLHSTHGPSIYGMHWLLDCDNFYGYGRRSDGTSKPSFINTFQRGVQESVYETIPHPSWETFKWGGPNGFLDLFTKDQSYSTQWRYTTAPDAEARIIQAMYWAWLYSNNGAQLDSTLMGKTRKMADFTRLSFFDKYFRPIGCQSPTAAGTGYDSCHYLISWYYSWGGGIASQWAWRIGSSHIHLGYQNPMAAWVLSNNTAFQTGTASNFVRDWTENLKRTVEMYQWLQAPQGLFGGGATNSYRGRYLTYPAGTPTFYNMAFVPAPVYEDPSSNEWFGMQLWTVERLCEYFYVSGDAKAKAVLDKFMSFVKQNVVLDGDTYRIPVTLIWSGKPDTWSGTAPANTGLSVRLPNVENEGWDGRKNDVDMASCLAKSITFYAAGLREHATPDTEIETLNREILDRMWTNYRTPKGVGIPEEFWSLERWMTQTIYVPTGWTGKMANGDTIQPGIKFLDIRSKFRTDPLGAQCIAAYDVWSQTKANEDLPKFLTHRFWGEVDAATANLEYGMLLADNDTTPEPTVVSTPEVTPIVTPVVTAEPGTPEPTANLDCLLIGDTNASNTVDIVDALRCAQYYVGNPVANFNAICADVNCSGSVDIVDALLIARFYVGLITTFPCQ